VEIFKEEIDPFKDVSRLGLLLQPISLNMISHFSRNGGNALVLTAEDGPLIRMWWEPQNQELRIDFVYSS